MANPVTVADLEARWRPLTFDEQIVAQSLLDDAWAVLAARLTTLDARVTTGAVAAGAVVAVVSAMALRVLRNPEGLVQYNRSIDDYTEGGRRADAVADGFLYATSAELALLRPVMTGSRRSVPLSAHGDWQRAHP